MSEPAVTIVGSGPGGSALAFALTRAGVDVLVLEAGPRLDPAAWGLDQPDWELRGVPAAPRDRVRFAPMQALDKNDDLASWSLAEGRKNTTSYRQAVRVHHVRAVGGSSLHFTGEAHRLHPASFHLHRDFGVGADWPLDYDELEPWYLDAERIIGVAGPAAPSGRPRSGPMPLPAHPASFASQQLLAAGAKLGQTWEGNTRAALSEPYDGRPACNYCGQCNRGCPRTDKGSADVTFLRKALATGRCTLRTDTEVVGIRRAGDRVDGVELADGSFLPTRVLALACGAIETPRLLLLADGLANEEGQVGRNFLETHTWSASALHPEPLASWRGLPADVICWDWSRPDAIPGVVGGARFGAGVHEAGFGGALAYAERVVAGFGAAHAARMREVFGRVLTVASVGECLPDPESYVDLDPEARDAAGRPLARVHSHVDDMGRARLRFMAARCRELLDAAGATERVEEYGSWDLFSSTHLFGTCRMGTDPRASVVDPGQRAHRWRNLFVADASVLPSTGGGEAPSLTIEALSLRLGDRLRGAFARGDL